jgi:hypothetical protein
MAVEKRPSWYNAAGHCDWGKLPNLRPWSGAQRTATGFEGRDAATDPAYGVTGDGDRRVGADRSKRRVVRLKGVPKAVNDPAEERRNIAKLVGDVRMLRGFQDTQMHELNSVIALRNAKALAMSLGLDCCFAWPVLGAKDDAIIFWRSSRWS